MNLTVLLDPLDLPRLTQVLDEIGHVGRVDVIKEWHLETQALLFEAIAGKARTLEDLVPSGTAPLAEVVHTGQNTLTFFSHFETRFCRAEGAEVLYGYHHHALGGLTGPGYFVARAEGDEVLIDCTEMPIAKPDAWPPLAKNEEKLGRFVYGGRIDVVRALSTHVSIGRAKKKGKFTDHYFVLVRRDPDAT